MPCTSTTQFLNVDAFHSHLFLLVPVRPFMVVQYISYQYLPLKAHWANKQGSCPNPCMLTQPVILRGTVVKHMPHGPPQYFAWVSVSVMYPDVSCLRSQDNVIPTPSLNPTQSSRIFFPCSTVIMSLPWLAHGDVSVLPLPSTRIAGVLRSCPDQQCNTNQSESSLEYHPRKRPLSTKHGNFPNRHR